MLVPPPVAVMVTVETPTTALVPAENVNVLWPLPGVAMLVGAKLAVTPLGSPLADRATAELNPVPPAVVTVIGTDPLRATPALLALIESANVPVTVRLKVWVLVTPPPAAVMVRLEFPAGALADAVNVKVLLPLPGEAMLVGAKEAVTPAGSPLTDKATAELKPFATAVVTVTGVEAPEAMLPLVALDESVNVGAGETARLRVMVFVMPPPAAVMVSVELPVEAADAAARVKVLEPLPGEAMLVGAKVPVTPDGSPLIDNATAELNPLDAAVVIVIGVEEPTATLALLELVESERLGAGETVRVTV